VDNTEPTPEQLAEWESWCDERPPKVAEVARRLPPWKLYRLHPPGQIVRILHYDEQENGDVTLTVSVDDDLNFVMFEREVFGVNPSNLTECDPPSGTELVGALIHGEAVAEFIDDSLRPAFLGAEEAERVRRQLEEDRDE
jgi:hypothetical protein